MPHYYSGRAGGSKPRRLISSFIRGVGVEFVTMPGVFSPDRIDPGTRILVEQALIPSEGIILDMGCGYGAIGITLAKAYPGLTVYMVDINEDAVKLARINAKRNSVEERVRIFHGDLYSPLPLNISFDAILSNPPLSAGLSVVKRLVEEAPKHLGHGGTLQLVVWKAHKSIARMLMEAFGNIEVLTAKKGYRVLLARKP